MVRKRAADKFLRFADTHAREAAEIGPLVREGTEAIARVDEYRSMTQQRSDDSPVGKRSSTTELLRRSKRNTDG